MIMNIIIMCIVTAVMLFIFSRFIITSVVDKRDVIILESDSEELKTIFFVAHEIKKVCNNAIDNKHSLITLKSTIDERFERLE